MGIRSVSLCSSIHNEAVTVTSKVSLKSVGQIETDTRPIKTGLGPTLQDETVAVTHIAKLCKYHSN